MERMSTKISTQSMVRERKYINKNGRRLQMVYEIHKKVRGKQMKKYMKIIHIYVYGSLKILKN